jgi:hypothetical protein
MWRLQDELAEGSDLFDDDDGMLVNAADANIEDDDESDVNGAIPGIDTDAEDEDVDSDITAVKPVSTTTSAEYNSVAAGL